MKKITTWIGMFCLSVVPALAQDDSSDSAEIESMGEILISSQRLGETRLNTTRQIEVIHGKQMALAQQGNMGDVLSQTGQVMVQKSQMGGGSPVLRGFEASRVLMVVDGVRMNNATYRAGHLQDIISVDQFMLERVELFFGSGSTLYGSDALGGVIYFKTRDPKFRTDKPGFGFAHAHTNMRYMSASKSLVGNLGFELSGQKVAWLVNFTRSDFGDLRMGQQRNFSNIDTFGYRNYYVDRIGGRDTQLRNSDPFIQKGSGYSQNDLFTKLAIKTGKLTHLLNFQFSNADVIPRYDRMTDVRNNALRYATWDYAPQKRRFMSYTLEMPNMGKLKQRFILSNQFTEVGRVTRSFKNANEKTQLDKVGMSAINYDAAYAWNDAFKLNGGLEVVANKVVSTASNLNINTNTRTEIQDTRYANGGANTMSAGIYVNGTYVVRPNDLIVEAGVRVTRYSLIANFTDQNFLKLPYRTAEVKNMAPVFNMGLTKNMGLKGLFFKASVSTGFRNPNVDDMTKLFESATGIKLVIPNDQLKPERTTTSEIAISYSGANARFEAGTYYTKIDQLLIDQRATYNGSDSFLYDGVMTPVFQMANTAGGFVRGSWFAAKVRVVSNLFADFNYTTTYGRYKSTENSAWVPLDHIAPDHGRAGLRWVASDWEMEAFMLFNGWKRGIDYSPSGEDNGVYSPGGKTPSWETYNLRASWMVNKNLNLAFALENIFDLRYRVFASGINSPGRNLTVSLRATL